MPMQIAELPLSVRAPFSLRHTVLSHGWHECAPMSWCEAAGCFQLIERVGEEVCRVSVFEKRRGARSIALRAMVEARDVSPGTLEELEGRLRLILQLDADLSEFHDLCREHPTLHVLPEIGAGRLIRAASMTENVIKAMCGTNVVWSQAVKMINRLAQLGPAFPHFANLNAWPSPKEILTAGDDYLLNVARLGYRTEYLLELCQSILSGETDLDVLDEEATEPDADALFRRLTCVKGIGKTTAGSLLGMLGHHDRLTIDTSTLAHVARTHCNGRKPSPAEVEAMYAPYGKWRNLVWWFEHWLGWGVHRPA